MIEDRIIEEIRDRIDIVDVVSSYIELRRSGSNFKALCPFHEEKTPSFMVSPQKQIFHCFGCNRGGNVFTFVMEMEGVGFPEAVRSLGKRCGIEVPVGTSRDKDKRDKTYEPFYAANEFAAGWYHANLLEGEGAGEARAYLESRGFGRELWEKFRLGAAGKGWDELFRAARKRGVPLDVLKQLKLVVRSESSGKYRDYFRQRLMFPITSPSGRVIGFAGRVLGEGEPKYINSAESPVFAKRKTLYGMEQARGAIAKNREVLLVEGYFDCISLHVAGFANCLASCGTALTAAHGSVLRRVARRVVILPDGDEAGRKAAVSSGALLLAARMDVQVAPVPDGEDPDSIAGREGADGIAAIIERAMDYFSFLKYIISKGPLSFADKEDLVRRSVEGMATCSDELHRDMLVTELASAFGLDVETLRGRARDARRYRIREEGKSGLGGSDERRGRPALERMTLRLVMHGGEAAAEAFRRLDAEDFTDESARELYKLLDSAVERNIDLGSSELQKAAEKAGLGGLAAEIALIPIPPGDTAKLLEDHVKRMKEFKIRDELDALSEEMQKLPEGSEEAIALAEYYNKLKIALAEL